MKSEIKFTSDGKKVIVVGKLNSQETIVQEIFIYNEVEIPSGENFVVKSLHDAPALSWKEKSLIELEERYEKDRKKFQSEIDNLTRDYRDKTKELRLKLQYTGAALKNVDEKSFNLLVDFICGNITHIIIIQYNTPDIIDFAEFKKLYEDKLRLFSIFGKDDGSFRYAVSEYSDYSGGNKTFVPFSNYEEAFVYFKDTLQLCAISDEVIGLAIKYDIALDAVKMAEWKKKRIESIKKQIEQYNKEITKNESQIEKLQ